jgi:hypothetical protein
MDTPGGVILLCVENLEVVTSSSIPAGELKRHSNPDAWLTLGFLLGFSATLAGLVPMIFVAG